MSQLFNGENSEEFKLVDVRLGANVPILKICHCVSNIEVDISLNNKLAVENSELLKNYAEMDDCVKILGSTLKYFTNVFRIGDASEGFLSSYAQKNLM
jgi:DNA polymerase sigma